MTLFASLRLCVSALKKSVADHSPLLVLRLNLPHPSRIKLKRLQPRSQPVLLEVGGMAMARGSGLKEH
jgi:hypothetical protein